MPTLTPRETVREHLLGRMLVGALEPGDRIALPQVARKLGISVTPVREALMQLSYSGLVVYRESRGFAVDELSVPEAYRLYHAVVALETEALRAGAASVDLPQLRQASRAFAQATDASARFRRDVDFHEALTVYFRGSAIWHLLGDLRARIYHYERAYLEGDDHAAASVELHERIVACLERGDGPGAEAALRQNWLNVEPVLEAAGLISTEGPATSPILPSPAP